VSARARARRHLRRRVVGLERSAIRRELVDAQTEERHADIAAAYRVMGEREAVARARSQDRFVLPRRLR
jgi:hypothetical protein